MRRSGISKRNRHSSAAGPRRRSPNTTLELRIEALAAGGDGVAHHPDGRVVFVPFTAPGDRVRVQVVQEKSRYLRARVETLLSPGPARTDPVCPVFGGCGGCAWQHIAYAAQLAAKVGIVEDALRRVGGLAYTEEVRITPSPAEYGYRSRARVLRHEGRVGYRKRGSRSLQVVSRCPVLEPALDHELHRLSEAADPAARGEWEIAAAGELTRAIELEAPAHEPVLRLDAAGETLDVSPGVFFQANAALRAPLADAVASATGSGSNAIELFAGAGFFTLSLSRRFERVTAVEAHPAAARDLVANLRRAGRDNVEVWSTRLEDAVVRLPGAELLLLDPPRTGLPAGSAVPLVARRPERIVYLSCDPATLARDLGALGGERYALRHVEAFDLFPQTPHVETLAVLEALA